MYSLNYKVTTSTCDSEGKLKLFSALQMMQDCSEMWIDCYGKSALKGHIFCGGVGSPNEIAGNAKLQEAYEMGKQV